MSAAQVRKRQLFPDGVDDPGRWQVRNVLVH